MKFKIEIYEKKGFANSIIIFIICLVVFFGGTFISYCYVSAHFTEETELTKYALFGDSFGAVSAFFSALAFAGVIFTLFIQRKELKLQRKDLELQRFENIFFQLLKTHSDIVNAIDLRKKKGGMITGRDCFKNFLNKLEEAIGNHCHTASIEKTLTAYDCVFNKHQNDLGHYFRNLYQIIKYVDKSDIEDKKTYTNFVRAQLSSHELVLIFYNCLSQYGKEKFKPLVEKYALFGNMDRGLVFNQDHLNEYKLEVYE